jgi:hypothetical protein
MFPAQWPRWRQSLRRRLKPARLGSLGSARPLSQSYGRERGSPIDRYYIEQFLAEHAEDIRGRVLEVKDSTYTRRFGRAVETADVLDINSANPQATVITDLSDASGVPANSYDCFILTQTLQFIFHTDAALAHAHRMLRPGGILLVTVPSVSRLEPNIGLTDDYWRFTPASGRALFEGVFKGGHVEVKSYGNVTSAIAFLAGAVQEDLEERQLRPVDLYFPLVVAVRAVKRRD